MADIELDPLTHDLKITDNKLALVSTSSKETVQKVKMALLLFKGEWFANTLEGVPYFQEIFIRYKNNSSKNIVDSILRNYINNIDVVKNIISFKSEVSPSTRVYSLTFKFEDIYGNIINLESLPIAGGI